jgi:signal peptidase II
MDPFKKILLIIISVCCLVGCDASSKYFAKKELKGQFSLSYLNGSLQLIYAENSGGMLSFGHELPGTFKYLIFQLFVSIMVVLLFLFLVIKKDLKKLQVVSLLLFLSGGLSNLLDRITNSGRVTDFIVVNIGYFHTGIFNIADIYITSGVIILIISSFVRSGNQLNETV